MRCGHAAWTPHAGPLGSTVPCDTVRRLFDRTRRWSRRAVPWFGTWRSRAGGGRKKKMRRRGIWQNIAKYPSVRVGSLHFFRSAFDSYGTIPRPPRHSFTRRDLCRSAGVRALPPKFHSPPRLGRERGRPHRKPTVAASGRYLPTDSFGRASSPPPPFANPSASSPVRGNNEPVGTLSPAAVAKKSARRLYRSRSRAAAGLAKERRRRFVGVRRTTDTELLPAWAASASASAGAAGGGRRGRCYPSRTREGDAFANRVCYPTAQDGRTLLHVAAERKNLVRRSSRTPPRRLEGEWAAAAATASATIRGPGGPGAAAQRCRLDGGRGGGLLLAASEKNFEARALTRRRRCPHVVAPPRSSRSDLWHFFISFSTDIGGGTTADRRVERCGGGESVDSLGKKKSHAIFHLVSHYLMLC